MSLRDMIKNDPAIAPPFHAIELPNGDLIWVQVYVWSVADDNGAALPQPALEVSANEIMVRDWVADFPSLTTEVISALYTQARKISGLSSQARVNTGFLVFSAALDGRMFAILPPDVQAAVVQYRRPNDSALPTTVLRTPTEEE